MFRLGNEEGYDFIEIFTNATLSTSAGDVLPCVFARSKACGNILSQPLQAVLKDQPLQSCWCTTKDRWRSVRIESIVMPVRIAVRSLGGAIPANADLLRQLAARIIHTAESGMKRTTNEIIRSDKKPRKFAAFLRIEGLTGRSPVKRLVYH